MSILELSEFFIFQWKLTAKLPIPILILYVKFVHSTVDETQLWFVVLVKRENFPREIKHYFYSGLWIREVYSDDKKLVARGRPGADDSFQTEQRLR